MFGDTNSVEQLAMMTSLLPNYVPDICKNNKSLTRRLVSYVMEKWGQVRVMMTSCVKMTSHVGLTCWQIGHQLNGKLENNEISNVVKQVNNIQNHNISTKFPNDIWHKNLCSIEVIQVCAGLRLILRNVLVDSPECVSNMENKNLLNFICITRPQSEGNNDPIMKFLSENEPLNVSHLNLQHQNSKFWEISDVYRASTAMLGVKIIVR